MSKLRRFHTALLTVAMLLTMGLSATADSIPNRGKVTFDFQDKAFFTVNMTSEEKVYLDLDTTFQKSFANNFDEDFAMFYNFKGTHDTFNHKGFLLLPGEVGASVYEIDENEDLVLVDSVYVEDYVTGTLGHKVSGYLIETKTLGNYALVMD